MTGDELGRFTRPDRLNRLVMRCVKLGRILSIHILSMTRDGVFI